ncbi:hypothetical protein LCGC14_2950360 [marine sediment metagenome]|uniref:Uncharacterized protein n=1 Tax=marine sediment metagenome TaxID=412755 RepID=A0A0F8ZN18_9ZZZZ
MTKKIEIEKASGFLAGIRSIIFDAIDEVEFRVSNLIAATSIAITDIVDQVFSLGKGLVLGLVYGAVGATQTFVTQVFLLITALVTVVIGAEE